ADKQVGRTEGRQRGGGVDFSFSPDGTLLAARSDWTGRLWLWNPQSCRLLFSARAYAYELRFSPDGQFLASIEKPDQLGLWEVAAEREYRTLTANPLRGDLAFNNLAVDADGRLVAAGASDAG